MAIIKDDFRVMSHFGLEMCNREHFNNHFVNIASNRARSIEQICNSIREAIRVVTNPRTNRSYKVGYTKALVANGASNGKIILLSERVLDALERNRFLAIHDRVPVSYVAMKNEIIPSNKELPITYYKLIEVISYLKRARNISYCFVERNTMRFCDELITDNQVHLY
ncbi:hypothetical protein AB6G29_23795 [Providencia hangzhouensis]|uniref:hypothetical protein n=1 Tax=Providencia hangzhouensis TaxID=3031799 RepID=UPI0034DD1C31